MAGTEDTKFELYAINCHRGSGFGGHYLSYVLKD
jgi:ubiquitin C-terminal hydrolase